MTARLCISVLVLVAVASSASRAQTCPPPLGTDPALLGIQYRPSRVLTYAQGRDTLYSRWAVERGGAIRTVYTGKEVPLTAGDPTQVLYRQGVNTEHSWPRSRGSDGWPAEADLHILFPSDERTNSRRGNLPYATVPDDQVVTWSAGGDSFRGPPPGAWVSRIGPDAFEPPDPVKGDLARAHLYFALVYPERARGSFFDRELPDLVQWSIDDPPSREELIRDDVIRGIQGNCNPFVHWPDLALEWLDMADDPDVCGDLAHALESFALESTIRSRTGTCEILAFGPTDEVALAGDPAEDLRNWFEWNGWEEDLSRAVDGPGTTAFTFARPPVACDVAAGAPSALEDGEIVVADEYELNVACRRSSDSVR